MPGGREFLEADSSLILVAELCVLEVIPRMPYFTASQGCSMLGETATSTSLGGQYTACQHHNNQASTCLTRTTTTERSRPCKTCLNMIK